MPTAAYGSSQESNISSAVYRTAMLLTPASLSVFAMRFSRAVIVWHNGKSDIHTDAKIFHLEHKYALC